MKLTGKRRIQIASGVSGLPASVVAEYRELWRRQGYDLPEIQGVLTCPQVRSDIGSCLKKIIFRETASEIKCRRCLEEIDRLNSMSPPEVERDRRAIVDGIMKRGRHQLKWWSPKGFAIRIAPTKVREMVDSWVQEAINSEKKPQHPLAKSVSRWAVGVTTAPRPVPTVDRTIESLKEGGFYPVVFAEPDCEVNLDCLVVQRESRLGCWRNYVQTLKDLLRLFPHAEAIAVFQDDVVVCRDIREFLEHDLFPSPHTGAVSLYSAEEYESGDAVGIDRRGKMILGLCAAIYPRRVAERLVSDEFSKDWRGCHNSKGYVEQPELKKAADTWVAESVKAMGLNIYHYRPSFVQHIADTSAIGHGGSSQVRSTTQKFYRKSKHFVGENTSAFDVWKDSMPWCRWSVPQGHQRYRIVDSLPQRKVTVVIPGYGCPDLTEQCLRQIERSTVQPSVIYSDDGSSQEVFDRVKQIKTTLDLRFVRSESNRGFAIACNAGIAAADPESHIILLNNDTLIGEHCIERLRYHAELHLPAGAVGPVTGDDGNQSVRRQEIRKLSKWKGDFDRDRYSPESERYLTRRLVQPRDVLSGFCMFLPRTSLDKIGPLSVEKEFAAGLGADDEWCFRAAKNGLVNMLVCDAWCAHLHKQTFRRMGVNRSALQRKAARKLMEYR